MVTVHGHVAMAINGRFLGNSAHSNQLYDVTITSTCMGVRMIPSGDSVQIHVHVYVHVHVHVHACTLYMYIHEYSS